MNRGGAGWPGMHDNETQKLGILALAMSGASMTEAVGWAEKQGQLQASRTEQLPTDNEYRKAYEALGFKFGAVASDPMWTEAMFPPGWSKRPTDHSMHTDIVDAQGRKRGSYFYKAAFYDQSANMYPPTTRYQVRADYEDEQAHRDAGRHVEHLTVVDTATDDVVFRVFNEAGTGDRSQWSPDQWTSADEVRLATRAQALAWLDENKPDWKDPGAYWS